MYQAFDLHGKTAIVTGGNSGIGLRYSGVGQASQNGVEIQIQRSAVVQVMPKGTVK